MEGTPALQEETPLLSKPQSSSPWTKERILIVALNCYTAFMWTVYYTVMVPLLPLYAEKYGFGKFEQGLVLASLQFGWFLGLPLVNKGWIQPRKLLLLGALAYVVAPAVVLVHTSLWSIVVGRIVEGFGSCLLLVLLKSVMAREIPAEIKGKAFGLRGFFGSFGLFFGPVVGGFLYPYGGLKLPMMLLTMMGLGGLGLCIMMVPAWWFASYEARITSAEANGVTMWQRLREVWRERKIRWLLGPHFCSWFFLGMMFMIVPDYVTHELKFTSGKVSLFWLMCDVAKMFGAVGGAYLADSLNAWSVFFYGLALHHVAQLTFGVTTLHSQPSVYVFAAACCAVFAFGSTEDGLLGPAFMKMLTVYEQTARANLKSEDRFEEILSMMEFVCSVAMTLGPLAAGLCYPLVGFALCIIICAVITGGMGLLSSWATYGILDVQLDSKADFHDVPFARSVSPWASLPHGQKAEKV